MSIRTRAQHVEARGSWLYSLVGQGGRLCQLGLLIPPFVYLRGHLDLLWGVFFSVYLSGVCVKC
jgi:hypothetical protein